MQKQKDADSIQLEMLVLGAASLGFLPAIPALRQVDPWQHGRLDDALLLRMEGPRKADGIVM